MCNTACRWRGLAVVAAASALAVGQSHHDRAGARPTTAPPAYDDWHYPAEEETELAALPPLRVTATSPESCSFTNGTHHAADAKVGDVVLAGWVVLAVIEHDRAGGSNADTNASTLSAATATATASTDGATTNTSRVCVVEYRFARWGMLRYLAPSTGSPGIVASLRSGVGCVSCLEPLQHRAYNYTHAIPGYAQSSAMPNSHRVAGFLDHDSVHFTARGRGPTWGACSSLTTTLASRSCVVANVSDLPATQQLSNGSCKVLAQGGGRPDRLPWYSHSRGQRRAHV